MASISRRLTRDFGSSDDVLAHTDRKDAMLGNRRCK
jgi:hypothetical protein